MTEIKNKKVLVTGATGFVGRHLVKRLSDMGYSVRALVRKGRDISSLDRSVDVIYGDITDPISLKDAVQGTVMVYHLAAVVTLAGVPDKLFWEVHVKGTENILNASLRHGAKRFIHISTCGVHGDIGNPPASEDSPIRTQDIYQKTKAEAEKVVMGFGEGVPAVIIRPTGVYGPGDMRLLKLFRLINNKRFFMVGSGKTFFHPVYIDDLIDSLILAGEVEKAVGKVFIIGGERYLTLNDLTNTIAKTLGVSLRKIHLPVFPVKTLAAIIEFVCKPLNIEPPIYRRRIDFFTKNRAFDISKAKKILGYQPKVAIEDGIRLTVDWYRKERLL